MRQLWSPLRIAVATAALAGGLLGIIGTATEAATPAAAATSGPDLTGSLGFPEDFALGNPNIDSLAISNVGNTAATGTTTITIAMPATVDMSDVVYRTCAVSAPGTCTLTWSISADEHTAVLTYTGTIAAGQQVTGFEVQGVIIGPVTNGAATITVSNPGDVNTSNNTSGAIDTAPAPTATGLTPTSGTPAGGTAITVTGTNLEGGWVSIGGSTDTESWCDDTTCLAATPAGGPGAATVEVTTPTGTASPGSFTYTNSVADLPPTVTLVSPASGTAGTAVTVYGTYLTGGSVAFGKVAGVSPSCSASSCTVTAPPGSGTESVAVTTPYGTSPVSVNAEFLYQAATVPAPVVTGISPSSGPATGATGVTISGSNLSGGTVAFGSAAATNVSCTASSCTATSPAGSGSVNVAVTTTGGTSAATVNTQFAYQASSTSSNLVPDPGFETSAIPVDDWGSTLARSGAVVHSGSWSLAQTTTSSSGGWDLDSNPTWYAPIASADTYTASIWVYATAAVKVDLNLDLLNSGGSYVNSANGSTVTLAAGTWTQLQITGIKPTSSETNAAMEPNFSKATKGTVIYWDDMSLTGT
ncbi:MAG: IPT/TIG domain-containing protein [Acidimicrobiales bacterium]